jgi:branched-subunit amino acid ABC-type transport system permease component
VLLLVGAIAIGGVGAVIEPTRLRPMYSRAEEYQLLVTFGLLLILEDVIRFAWGGTPLTAAVLMDALAAYRSSARATPVADQLYAIDRGDIIFEDLPQAVFDNEEVMKTIRG